MNEEKSLGLGAATLDLVCMCVQGFGMEVRVRGSIHIQVEWCIWALRAFERHTLGHSFSHDEYEG